MRERKNRKKVEERFRKGIGRGNNLPLLKYPVCKDKKTVLNTKFYIIS